jgi:hypothetical protein
MPWGLLERLTTEFQRRRPRVGIIPQSGSTEQNVERLRTAHLDVAICARAPWRASQAWGASRSHPNPWWSPSPGRIRARIWPNQSRDRECCARRWWRRASWHSGQFRIGRASDNRAPFSDARLTKLSSELPQSVSQLRLSNLPGLWSWRSYCMQQRLVAGSRGRVCAVCPSCLPICTFCVSTLSRSKQPRCAQSQAAEASTPPQP